MVMHGPMRCSRSMKLRDQAVRGPVAPIEEAGDRRGGVS
jgi:hypothetical protein